METLAKVLKKILSILHSINLQYYVTLISFYKNLLIKYIEKQSII
jgi:hypothetical protein